MVKRILFGEFSNLIPPHPNPLLAERELLTKKNYLRICGKEKFYKNKKQKSKLNDSCSYKY
jgi:hypothetical protein